MILKKPDHVPHICMVGVLKRLKDGPLNNLEIILQLPARYRLDSILTRNSRGLEAMLNDSQGESAPFKHYFAEYRWNMESMEIVRDRSVLIEATFMSEGFTYAP